MPGRYICRKVIWNCCECILSLKRLGYKWEDRAALRDPKGQREDPRGAAVAIRGAFAAVGVDREPEIVALEVVGMRLAIEEQRMQRQHRFEQSQRRPCRLALRRAGDARQSPINRSPVNQVVQIIQ